MNKITSNKFNRLCELGKSFLFLSIIILFGISSLINVIDLFYDTKTTSEFFTNLFSFTIFITITIIIVCNLYIIRGKSFRIDESMFDNIKIIKIIGIISSVTLIITSIVNISTYNYLVEYIRRSDYIQKEIVRLNIDFNAFTKIIGVANFLFVLIAISSILRIIIFVQGTNGIKTYYYEGKLYSFILYPIIGIISEVIGLIVFAYLKSDQSVLQLMELSGTNLGIGIMDIISYAVSIVYSVLIFILLVKIRNIVLTEKK